MKLGLVSPQLWASCILLPWMAFLVFCAFHGVHTAEVDTKNVDINPVLVDLPSLKKKNGNGNRNGIQLECREKDEKCETDKLGLEAIRSLHLLIDDDHNGNVDQHESDEFLRDELQYTDGFERQALFHNNDKFISVEDLWRAWKRSVVHNWTVDDVHDWLVQDVDLPQYAPTFLENNIDGSVLPRLVNSTSTLLAALGIRNMHRQRLALKAMDAVLFGAPKRGHSFTKDLLLVSSLILAIGGCWFACLHHRYSQTQVKKMMKDLESLQKAEDALKKLSNELAHAEKNQTSLSQEKQEELRMLRQNSVRLKVPLMTGDKSPKALSREGSVVARKEGEKKLKQAEEELSALREALTEAESRLELQQQIDSQWSVPSELQAWLQLTHEMEMQQHSIKKQAAERQRQMARDGCDKIKKRNKAFFGSLRIAHSNSLDDIEQSIMDARAALEEVRQDLQESQQRWQVMEILCGFPIIVNPGLTALRQALGREPSGNLSRGGGASLLQPGAIDEAEEDMQSAGYATTTLPSASKSSAFLSKQGMAGSTNSLPHATNTTVAAPLPRRDSRDTELLLRGIADGNMAAATNTTTFHLGDKYGAGHERTHSNASLSMVSPILSNGHHMHHHHHPHHHLRAPYGQSLSHPPFHMSSSTPTPLVTGGASTSNIPLSHRAGGGGGTPSGKMFNSAGPSSGQHLKKQISSPHVTGMVQSTSRNGFHSNQVTKDTSVEGVGRQESSESNSHHTGQALDMTDRTSLGSAGAGGYTSTVSKSRLDRTPELDLSSLDTDSVYSGQSPADNDGESPTTPGQMSPPTLGEGRKKSSKRKKFLPNFLQKGKGKQKTS